MVSGDGVLRGIVGHECIWANKLEACIFRGGKVMLFMRVTPVIRDQFGIEWNPCNG